MPQLNKKIEDFLTSSLIVDEIGNLNAEYNIKKGYLAGLVYDLAVGNKEFSELRNYLQDDFKINLNQSKQIASDILGKLFLCIENDLGKDIKGAIKKVGGRAEDYYEFAKKLNEKIYLKEELPIATEEEEEAVPAQNPKEEKESLEELLRTDMKGVLEETDPEMIGMLNYHMLNLLNNNPEYMTDIEKAVLENSQKITNERIDLEGKKVDPTVSSWLLDFISRVGIDNITVISQSKYLTDSKNTKNLSFEERKKLGKLLEFYKRFKQFPESLEKLPPNEWGLIPVEIGLRGKFEAKAKAEKTPETEGQIQELKKQYDALADKKSLEARAIAQEIKRLGG